MKKNLQIISLISIALVLFACQETTKSKDGDKTLARVFKHELLASDIEGMFIDSPSEQDSILLANAYVENWVRENLIMQEAEKNIPKDLNIDELVRDYRASLIKHNYEKLIIELQLDSTISRNEIEEYHNKNIDQFKLEEPLILIKYVKLPISIENVDEVKSWWDSSTDSVSYHRLLDYCGRFSSFYIIGDGKWVPYREIKSELPSNIGLPQLTKGSNRTVKGNEFLHLIEVIDRLEKGANAPIDHIKNKAEKVILHQRKIQLLKDKKEEMYNRELNLKNIEIY